MAFFDTTWYTNFGDGSTTGYYAVGAWTALTAYTAGQWVRQLAAPAVGSERCFVCIIAGTSLAAEPTWTVTRGAKTAEAAGPTWQECTGMSGPCGDTTNSAVWVASRVLTLGEVYYDATSSSLQICSTAGTSKTAPQPSFSATAGTTTADNTATWTSLGATSNYTTAFKYPHARLSNAFATTWGVAGNQFAVASNNAETRAAPLTLNSPGTQANPCSVYCISNTTTLANATLATTASFNSTTTNSLGVSTTNNASYYYGCQFLAGTTNNAANITVGTQNALLPTFLESCKLTLNNTASGSNISLSATDEYGIFCTNCDFVFGATSQTMNSGNLNSGATIIGGTIAATGSVPTTLFSPNTFGATSYMVLRDVDLSNVTGTITTSPTRGGHTTMQNCKLGASVVFMTSQIEYMNFIKAHNCDSTNTNYRYYFANAIGTVQQETTVVRTGGATNGTTPISWAIATTANAKFTQPFVSEQLAAWHTTTGSAFTITVYLTTNTTLTNGDFWIEVEALTTSGFPLATNTTTRPNPLASTTALTTDSSSVWGGSISNKYVITTTVTPQSAGPIKVRLYASKASVTIYADPFFTVSSALGSTKSSGRQYFIPEWGFINEGAPSLIQVPLTGGIHG